MHSENNLHDYDAFHAITVRIPSLGQTGFWIYPEFIITCAHGKKNGFKEGDNINIIIDNSPVPAKVVQFDKLSDILLLKPLSGCPAQLFSLSQDVKPGDALYSWVYTPRNPKGGESVLVEVEGWSRSPQLLKLSKGMVEPGMSGAPLYSLRNRSIVGMIKITRDRNAPSGGRAVPAATILEVCDLIGINPILKSDPRIVSKEDLPTILGIIEAAYTSAKPMPPIERTLLIKGHLGWEEGERIAAALSQIAEHYDNIRADVIPRWHEANPHCLRFIVLESDVGNRRIGVTCVLPLREESYKNYRSGMIRELDFTKKDIISTHEGGKSIWLCFQSFAISIEYTRHIQELVRNAFREHVEEMAPENRLPRVIAELGTNAGYVEARHFGLKFVDFSADKRPLVELDLAARGEI